jgi:mono/diheme cytochrome c family protein
MTPLGVDRSVFRLQGRWILRALLWSAVWSAAIAGDRRCCAAAPAGGAGAATAADAAGGDPERGLDLLRSHGYLPPDFDQEVFDALWTTWEEPLRSRAESLDPVGRRRLAMERYGLQPHPDDPSRSVQYVVDASGGWTMSCLACHQGQVGGVAIPGVPNSNYALETLTEEVRLVKARQRKAFGHMDIGSLLLPLGTTVGTTNAVVFGVALMRHRDAELNVVARPPRFDLPHHDMDAPAWWHYPKRRSLYADGFAAKGHRMLMQFLLVKENGPERFREWEDDFRHVEAWIESLEPPAWPGPIDTGLAARGAVVFVDHCGECHGTYGAAESYPERLVPIDVVGTDRVRLDALSREERRDLNGSWFGHFGADAASLEERTEPVGYVAPPLDGVWATAPYFHNGSVPTLWHVLHPDRRPAVWRRSPTGYDTLRVGLEVEERDDLPDGPLLPAVRRTWFDTRRAGKTAAGHDFAEVLDDDEKAAVLEYLKTL